MKIQNHCLARDDGQGASFLASPHTGGVIAPSLLVLHYTAGSSAASTVAWFRNPQSRVSAHRVIGRDGSVTQLMPFNR